MVEVIYVSLKGGKYTKKNYVEQEQTKLA